jgi:hypothetical protein
MSALRNRRLIKNLLGELPLTAELYWKLFQHGKPVTRGFSMRRTQKWLPHWCAQAELAAARNPFPDHPKKNVLIFSTLRYWIEHAALVGVALSGMGHRVTLSYLPYPSFNRPLSRFDIRRNNVYAHGVLKAASPVMEPLSFLDVRRPPLDSIPASLAQAVREVSLRDTQYTLQIEKVDTENLHTPSGQLFRLRQQRNLNAAAAMLGWYESLRPEQRPEVLLTPNGSILEMGALFQTARYLDLPAVTYEFGEQRGRIWLAQNSEVMLQETEDLWEHRRDDPLTEAQWDQIRSLYDSRQNGRLWENFSRLWQGLPSQGGERVRQELGLDLRPVVLLAANVIGDSLTLGRQVFSKDMTEWLQRSVRFFFDRPQVQLVVRIHPGERYLKGPSVAEVVKEALPQLPENIHLVEAPAPVNTYDLVEIASLGLVYTTTVGMEMAMSGVPVVVGGKTHYRGKGFTLDPVTWEENFQLIDQVLQRPEGFRPSRGQIELGWNYAYRFFFEYPSSFPWHLLNYWNELETWPVERVLSGEGLEVFGPTFDYLVGEPRLWSLADREKIEAL